jgi:hypothetical protein
MRSSETAAGTEPGRREAILGMIEQGLREIRAMVR